MHARTIGGKEHSFSVSGLLWNDNVLMYDRQTKSLWSQMKREAVASPLTGARLTAYPSTVTTWAKWRKRHPNTRVLSFETGFERDYSRDPNESYYRSRSGLLSQFRPGPGEQAKELVVGVELAGGFRAYPLVLLRKRSSVQDRISGRTLTVMFDALTDQVSIRTAGGKDLVSVVTYWFVWKGIHPGTDHYRADP